MKGERKEQGRITGVLSMEFTVSDGNELFQDFFMGRRHYPLTQFIKEEDRARFKELVETQGGAGFETAVRILDPKEEYRWYYLYLKKFQAENGQEFYSVKMRDICRMEDRLAALERAAWRYKRFLSMQNPMYFVYLYQTGSLTIFCLTGDSTHVLSEQTLEEWEKTALPEEEEEFRMFCGDIRAGTDQFVHDISSSQLSLDGSIKLYRFRGMTWKQKGRLKECYGTIQLLDKKTKRAEPDRSIDSQLDPLTGLYNKRCSLKMLHRHVEENSDSMLTICILDLDNFKALNDTYGHLFGDRVLTVAADTMREVLGNRGIAGRFGGDEFFLMIDSGIDEQGVRQILFTIRKNIRWFFEKSVDRLVVTLSVGAASFPKDAADADELFAKADRALYIAKEKGKDRFIIYDEAKHGSVTFDSEHRKIVELSAQKKEENKTAAVLYVYDLLERKRTAGIGEAMGFIGKTYAIDRINIFLRSDLRLWKAWGYETWRQDGAAYILKEEYLNNFNSGKADVCNGIEARAYKYPKTYEYMDKLGIKSCLQYIIGEGTKVSGLISYELCKIRRKWSKEDAHDLILLSRFMENTILKEGK